MCLVRRCWGRMCWCRVCWGRVCWVGSVGVECDWVESVGVGCVGVKCVGVECVGLECLTCWLVFDLPLLFLLGLWRRGPLHSFPQIAASYLLPILPCSLAIVRHVCLRLPFVAAGRSFCWCCCWRFLVPALVRSLRSVSIRSRPILSCPPPRLASFPWWLRAFFRSLVVFAVDRSRLHVYVGLFPAPVG